MNSNWNYPTTAWIGENRIEDLSKACSELNIKKPLFILNNLRLINLDSGVNKKCGGEMVIYYIFI